MFFFCLFSPNPVSNPFCSWCFGEQQDSTKGKGFYCTLSHCVKIVVSLIQLWVIQILKAFWQNSSVVNQLLRMTLKASPCCRRALYSLCQKMSHRNKWEHTYSALQTVNGRLLVVCGLLKAFSGICVKANSFCCYSLWSRDFVFCMKTSSSTLAYQDSALLMWSCSKYFIANSFIKAWDVIIACFSV